MAGIIVGTRFAAMLTVIITAFNLVLAYLQTISVYKPNVYWKNRGVDFSDIAVAMLTLSVILVVSWLSNREIERSLKRARKSEEELKKERDLLEVRVEERIRELKEAQMEKMMQLTRFAEFGKLTSGIFHELINPLTTISLNLEHIKGLHARDFSDVKKELQRALNANKRMESFINLVRKQLKQQDEKSFFNIYKEIRGSVDILSYKARKVNVDVRVECGRTIKVFGNPLKFSQAITNIVSNAIDSYDNHKPDKREVIIKCAEQEDKIEVAIQDWGMGVLPENKSKIFEPFFTTKDNEDGMGLGLLITKEIIEHDFGGRLAVKSHKKNGTIFTIKIPVEVGQKSAGKM
jgi:C4-dicarboxylate-specific signal transduction histidine kinase